jgi:hypothetical protein
MMLGRAVWAGAEAGGADVVLDGTLAQAELSRQVATQQIERSDLMVSVHI